MIYTGEVTPALVKQAALGNLTLLDALVFDPALTRNSDFLHSIHTLAGRNYSADWLDKGVDLEHQVQQLQAVARYSAKFNKVNPDLPSYQFLDVDRITTFEDWRKPRIALYRTFTNLNRLEAATLVNLKVLEVSLLRRAHPTLEPECCQLVVEAWEQAFYRKFPAFAVAATFQFEDLAHALSQAGKSLATAVSFNVPALEITREALETKWAKQKEQGQ